MCIFKYKDPHFKLYFLKKKIIKKEVMILFKKEIKLGLGWC